MAKECIKFKEDLYIMKMTQESVLGCVKAPEPKIPASIPHPVTNLEFEPTCGNRAAGACLAVQDRFFSHFRYKFHFLFQLKFFWLEKEIGGKQNSYGILWGVNSFLMVFLENHG